MTTLIEGLLLDRLIQQVERRCHAQAANDEGGRERAKLNAEIIVLQTNIDNRDSLLLTLQGRRDQLLANHDLLEKRVKEISAGLDALREAAQAYLNPTKGRSKAGLASALLHKIGEAKKLSDSYIPF